MKNYILLFLFLFLSGCSFLNVLPNSSRDKWYMDHSEEIVEFHDEAISFLKRIEIGYSKERVIELWGVPLDKKTEDVWIYKFPKYSPSKFLVIFENNSVVETWDKK